MKVKKKNILAISRSTRKNSTNEQILKLIGKLYQDSLNVHLYKGIAELPHFDPGIDDQNIASSVKEFRKLIEEADGVIICTPEYVFSLPGSLKNAIEWTVSTTVFSKKPVALIVAAADGEKAYESLLLVMKTIEANIPAEGTLLIKGARAKFNSSGQIVDEKCLPEIMNLVNALVETIDLNSSGYKIEL